MRENADCVQKSNCCLFSHLASSLEVNGEHRHQIGQREVFWRLNLSCVHKMESRCVKAFRCLAAAGCCKQMCRSNGETVVDLPPPCVRDYLRLCGKCSARRIQEGKESISQATSAEES